MKKIFTILLALSAFSIVISGCKKPADDGGKTDGGKTDAGKTDTTKTDEAK